jgi:hypothetical protein
VIIPHFDAKGNRASAEVAPVSRQISVDARYGRWRNVVANVKRSTQICRGMVVHIPIAIDYRRDKIWKYIIKEAQSLPLSVENGSVPETERTSIASDSLYTYETYKHI